MMDFDERVIPGSSSNFMYMEALSRYIFALKFAQKNINVLDLGCGTGYGSACLAQRSKYVLGIDINLDAIKYASSHYKRKNLEFKKCDIFETGIFKEKYDLICSFEVIEHLTDPKKYLKIIKNSLNPYGVVLISTPNIKFSSPEGIIDSSYHVREFNLSELKNLLLGEFKKVEIFGQIKSKKAVASWKDFMKSQITRQSIVDSDKFGIRKLIPRGAKEKIWKVLGNFNGRKTQEDVGIKDFPIKSKSARNAHYFIALCHK